MSGVKLLMLFALKSMKPVKVNTKLVNGTHPVASWLRAHGKPVPDQEYQMSQVAMRELRECFEGLDEDSDGTISLTELREALTQTEVRQEVGAKLAPKSAPKPATDVTPTNSAARQLRLEFHPPHRPDQVFADASIIRGLFAHLDKDRSGEVQWDEFQRALQQFSEEDGALSDGSVGSGGSLGESMRLVLLAYTSRQHMKRQVRDR